MADVKFKDDYILLRDRIAYSKQAGDWNIQPALSFTWRSVKQEYRYSSANFVDGMPTLSTSGFNKYKETSLILTPAFNISYRNAINFAAGISARLEGEDVMSEDKIFPFASATIDVLRIGDAGSRQSLKFFASYAKAGNFYDNNLKQPDLITDFETTTAQYGIGGVYDPILSDPYPKDPKLHNFQAGATFSTAEDRLQISYNFDARRFRGQFIVPIPVIPNGIDFKMVYPDYFLATHRVSILARVVNPDKISWLSGINGSGFKYKLKEDIDYYDWNLSEPANNGKIAWTGGWVNRLRIKQFSFGADLLYQFNRKPYTGVGFETVNTFRLNDIFAAYSFKIANKKPFEIYIASRNLVQSKKWMIPDNRRYFGAGFNLNL